MVQERGGGSGRRFCNIYVLSEGAGGREGGREGREEDEGR